MKDLKRASVHGVAWNLVQNLIGRLLGLIVVAILARFLDRSAFGAIVLAGTVTTFAELLVSQGFGEFIAQRPNLTDEHSDTAFWFNASLGLVLTAIIALAAEPLAAALSEPSVAPIVRWLSLSLVLRSLSVVPTGILVRTMQFRALSLRSLIAMGIGGAGGIISAVAGLGIYSLVVQALATEVVGVIALWRATEWRPKWRFSRAHLRELTVFGLPIFGATLLNFASRRLDTVIVAGALGLTTLGVYSMGQRMFQMANQVLNKSSDAVTLSALSKLTDADRRRAALYRVVEITAVLCFPLYAGLAIVAEPLIVSVFSERWSDSTPVLAIFAVSGLPISLSYVHASALKSIAQTRSYLVIHILLISVYLPMLLLVVDRGPVAAAVAYLIALCVIVPVEIGLVRAALGIRLTDYAKALLGAVLATVVMSGVTCAVALATTELAPLLRLGTEAVAGAAAYLVALKLLAPATFRRCRDLLRRGSSQ